MPTIEKHLPESLAKDHDFKFKKAFHTKQHDAYKCSKCGLFLYIISNKINYNNLVSSMFPYVLEQGYFYYLNNNWLKIFPTIQNISCQEMMIRDILL